MKLKQIFSIVAMAVVTVAGFLPAATFAESEPLNLPGTNIVDSSGTVYMVSPDGSRRPYTSAGAFLSYGFNSWTTVVNFRGSDLSRPVGSFIPPQDGKIMCSDRGSDKGTCYLITGSTKAGFVSESVFRGLGYDFSQAMYGDVSFLPGAANIESASEPHRPGTLINVDGTVYLSNNNGLLGFPDSNTFTSWGYSFSNVVTANAADKIRLRSGIVSSRNPGSLNPNAYTVVVDPINTQTNIIASLSSLSPSGTIAPGNGVDLARFTIQAPASRAVTLKQLGFAFGGNFPAGSLSNLKLIYTLTNTEVGSNSGNVLNDNSILFNLYSPSGMNSSFKADFILRANVSSAAAGAGLDVRLTQIWTGDGVATNLEQNVSGLPVVGNRLSVSAASLMQLNTQVVNETWTLGSSRSMQWSGGLPSNTVSIHLDRTPSNCNGNNCATSMSYIAKNISNSGTFNWLVQAVDVDGYQIPNGTYYIVVQNSSNNESATSKGVIMISNGTYVKMNSPLSGATWTKGAPGTIEFSASGITQVNVFLLPYPTCTNASGAVSCSTLITPYRIGQNISTGYAGVGISVSRDLIDSRDIPAGQYLIKITDTSGTYTDTTFVPITLGN